MTFKRKRKTVNFLNVKEMLIWVFFKRMIVGITPVDIKSNVTSLF